MTRLQSRLVSVAHILNIRIVTDFEFQLSSGEKVVFDLLLLDFGAPRGTLVTSSSEAVAKCRREISDAGFGYSILSEPKSEDDYTVEGCVEMLSEWTWSGAEDAKPIWLRDVDDIDD